MEHLHGTGTELQKHHTSPELGSGSYRSYISRIISMLQAPRTEQEHLVETRYHLAH